ncbi:MULTISPECIES: tripartite tricarboxylate transporter TctB family protein [unclassified Uliginosibacterium]|uniref:tripartite tricarboxylate transporter TctB family protein n=1 Tax=unclassified Uliginosibacterium TaxID=2621521 RepID=UPI000C7B8134|nr:MULTISPECIES: tripartite tricarboxylate transporter TctB family protein [unclassified Uliginosibacterium]MDO6386012.1 tripartite tricarboxylate transporter TctB family protein [Uliginosibacterium sp. 31-12]PLK50019.1 tripartite tricarboxylate transporter TctB family protein [Uliginosibacterium sp. TH139]
MTHWPGRHQAYLAIGVIVLGLAMALQITQMPTGGGYARVGPNFFPGLIAAGLIIAGGALLLKSTRSLGHSSPADETGDEGVPPVPEAEWRGFALVSGTVLAHLALIGLIGFTLSAWLLCYGICRALDTPRRTLDLILSLGLALGLFHTFRALGVNLPAFIPGVL